MDKHNRDGTVGRGEESTTDFIIPLFIAGSVWVTVEWTRWEEEEGSLELLTGTRTCSSMIR